jgi:catechol 2,3-dioxygenase-like lactoylglutathione lyase family enzyme
MDVLSSRILLRPSDLDRSRRFYRGMLGLAIYREFGPRMIPGWCSSSARDCWRSLGTRSVLPGSR